MCVCSNSRNDVPRVAQRYGTIAAHTRRRASVLVVFVVFCVHMHSFAGLIRRTPPPTFSDTAITNRHSDTTIFQLRAHWVRISWSIGSEKSFGHVPPVGVEPSIPCVNGEHPIHLARRYAEKKMPHVILFVLHVDEWMRLLNIGKVGDSYGTVEKQVCKRENKIHRTLLCDIYPVGIWCQNDATLIQRHYYVICPLGTYIVLLFRQSYSVFFFFY